MKTIKSKGPRIEPLGTLANTFSQVRVATGPRKPRIPRMTSNLKG